LLKKLRGEQEANGKSDQVLVDLKLEALPMEQHLFLQHIQHIVLGHDEMMT
jgi:hypothetical protein